MDPAAQSLHELLFEQLSADDRLADPAKELILAAFDGDDALSAALDGTSPPRPTQPADASDRTVPGTFLRSITVEGFRGIAGEQRLDLKPGAGLTVVTGRNGSGKSSFAEAAEITLTGENERWRNKTTGWSRGFRNVHHNGPVRVGVELLREGSDKPIAVQRQWPEGAELDGSVAFLQRHGAKRGAYDVGVWSDLLTTYRPFLPYSELGKLITGKPSELHDALYSLLGLDSFSHTMRRIADREKTRRDEQARLTDDRKRLRADCAAAADDRARRAAELLAATRPDLQALSELALGDDTDEHTIGVLRGLTALVLPTEQQMREAADGLGTASARADNARTDETTTAKSAAELLRHGIAFHDAVGDAPCPVCRQGRLDASWREEAASAAAEFERSSQRLATAESELREAQQAARDLVTPVPAALGSDDSVLPTQDVHEAWQRWWSVRDINDHADFAAELLVRHRELAKRLDALRLLAEQELARRNEIWAPLARKVAHWHDQALAARPHSAQLTSLQAAKKWLTKAGDDLRNKRLQPFARESRRIWSLLRQQSSVELDGLTLAGSKTTRRVQVNVSVDGADSAALSVMSQGELHALGLSLFLPRATAPQSPFRFLVIDDPVQAMDPAKVDGLARVLAETSEHRQVVVFTHDDRLTESLRRLQLPATVLEVCRRERSEVSLREVADPVARYLSDADALVKTVDMPVDVRGELVATLCRSALEAASHAAVRARRLARGESHDSVEALLAAAETTHKRLTLAVLDDPNRTSELFGRLRPAGPRAIDTVQACKQGAHLPPNLDLRALVRETEKLARWVVGR
ncbi:AAA family ATPase [Saccharopolyspora gloriosae]|uniref:AAA family ATPase n=1 Tax=Saccharopolyspora gloriosae TaxID=455344 RepID=UPI001FB7FF13|nr:AAA family ATPase [Saccharopolyspora gloriosae]